jgi:hypothetical protein
MGMTVTYADDSVTTIQVKILLTLLVPHPASFAVIDSDVKKWIYVK